MITEAPLSAADRYARSIAWMHDPVHLSCAFLPWFLVRLIERALHSYLCHAEQYLLLLWELKEQGKLEPWPDATRHKQRPNYTMKFPPAAPKTRTGAKHVQISAQATAEAEVSPAAVDTTGACLAQRPALPRWNDGRALQPQSLRLTADRFRPPDRCRPAGFFCAAEMRRNNCVQIVPVS